MTELSRFRPYGGAGKLPVDCCEFSVVDEKTGKEVCRCWTEDEARRIAFLLDVNDCEKGRE